MISTTMHSNFLKKILYIFLAIAFWTLVWEAASFLISDNLKPFLPSPVAVIKSLFSISVTPQFWHAVMNSLVRIFKGLALGFLFGTVFGILTSKFKTVSVIVSPALKVIRAVPVVSFIILAFLFIKVDELPVVVCMFMVMPVVWQTVNDELNSFSTELNEMTVIYRIKGVKKLFFVTVPTVFEAILSTVITAVGLAWKSGIATEVLCAPEISIGKSLLWAKNRIEYEEVYAYTLTVVILSLVFEFLLRYLYNLWKARREK